MVIKKLIAAALAGVTMVASVTSVGALAIDENSSADSEVFFDDFNGNTLDSSKWLVAYKNWGGTDSSTGLPYNGGVVPQNVSVEDGTLVLTGHGNDYEGDLMGINRDLSTRSDGKRVGAAIATRDYYGSGSYEVRAKVAPELGACSAIWTFEYEEYYPGDEKYAELATGGSYYAVNHEIDIEMPGRPASTPKNQSFNYALCNTWTGEKSSEYTTNYTDIGVPQNDGQYHTYRFDWHTGDDGETPRVDFYFDGVLTTTNYTNIPTNKGRLWIGLWFPKAWAGTPNFDTTSFDVDYVKITPFNESGDTEANETYPYEGWATGTLFDKESVGNMLNNPNFDNGSDGWDISGDAKVEDGKAILASGCTTDSISQKIAVEGSETYRLTADVGSSGANVEIGVNDYNGRYTNISKTVNSDGKVTIDFSVASYMKEIEVYAKVLRYQDNKTDCTVDNLVLMPLNEALKNESSSTDSSVTTSTTQAVTTITTQAITTTTEQVTTKAPINTTTATTTKSATTTTAIATTAKPVVTTTEAIDSSLDSTDSEENLLLNGDFSNGSTSWKLTGSAKISNNMCVLASGSDTDEIYQTVSVVPGKTYKLICDVTSTGTEIEIGVSGATSKYSKNNVFTTNSKQVEIEFTVASGMKSVEIYGRVLRYQTSKTDCTADNFVLMEVK